MPNVTLSVAHRLSVGEARHRIAAWLARGGPGGVFRSLRDHWQGNHLQLEIVVGSTRITGQIGITRTNITAVADLPWHLLPFAAAVKEQVGNDLRELLDG